MSGLTPSVTLLQAKQMVLRATSHNTNDTVLLQEAEDCLKHAAAEWDRRHDWDWNAVEATGVAILPGSGTYDLPSDFSHVYTVRTTVNDRTLTYVDQREYDRSNWDQTASGTPEYYTLWGYGQNGNQMTLWPIPSATDTLELKYYRVISFPASDSATFGIPDQYVYALIDRATYRFLLNRDANNPRLPMFWKMSEEGFRQARTHDVEQPDADIYFHPGSHQLPWNPNDTTKYF